MKIRHYVTLHDVEIFATGKHNGDVYTAADLDAMVEAFNELDFKPALKAGHTEAPGTPALGYVDNLRREGEKLVGDIVDVPDSVNAQIAKKSFSRVSAEIYWNFERAGKTFKRALKAVALLGAEVPGVAGLKPLSAAFAEIKAEVRNYDREPLNFNNETGDNDIMNAEEKAAYEAKVKREAEAAAEAKYKAEADAKIKAETEAREKQYAADRKADQDRIARMEAERRDEKITKLVDSCAIPAVRPMLRAFAELAMTGEAATKKYTVGEKKDITPEAVVGELIAYINDKTKGLFTLHSVHTERKDDETVDATDRAAVAAKVDELTKAHIAANKGMKYSEALSAVLAAKDNAELARAYKAAA